MAKDIHNLADVHERITTVRKLRADDCEDPSDAHRLEDELMRDLLTAIAAGRFNLEIARCAAGLVAALAQEPAHRWYE